MIVRSILKSKGTAVEVVTPEITILAVSRILRQKRIGAVLVMLGEDIKGMLSERDIVRGICEYGEAVLQRPVSDLMTKTVVTCEMEDSLPVLMELMTNKRIRHIPVLEGGRLAGLVSIGDVVKNRIAEAEMEAQALKEYIVTG